MKISELLVESQQLDEGPILQTIGKVGGKIAKGAANIGKELKTGFKAGYGGTQPAAAPAETPAPAATDATAVTPPPAATPPVQKAKVAKAPAATPAPDAEVPAAAPAAAKTEPAADSTAEVAALKTELATLLKNYEDDLAMQNKNWKFVMPKVNALEKQVADLVAAGSAAPVAEPEVAPAAEPETKRRGGKVAGELSQTADAVRKRNARRDKANAAATTGGAGAFNQFAQQATQQNSSVNRTGRVVAEGFSLYRKR